MGADFLRQAQTLTKHRNRLVERPYRSGLPSKVLRIGSWSDRYQCYVNEMTALADADTGSDLDLVSASFARNLVGKRTRIAESEEIQFADGSRARIREKVLIQFKPYGRLESSPKWFYVLKDLTCDVLLGQDTLDELGAYNEHSSSTIHSLFQATLSLKAIMWLNRAERWLAKCTRLGSAKAGKHLSEVKYYIYTEKPA